MLKNIVVHLSGSDEDDARLAHAAQLTRMFTSHLTGAFVHEEPEMMAFSEPAATAAIKQIYDESLKRADAIAETLAPKLDKLGVSSELCRLEASAGRTGAVLAAACRTADLFVGTRPHGGAAESARIAEAVLLGSGRGCLFAPPGVSPPDAYSTCLVAWNGSREAARAVAEALPLLAKAQTVFVVIIEDGASEQSGMEAGTDIGRYLSRHGVEAEVRAIAGWHDAGEAIVNEARMIGAQVIVMGGYGHSRLREWVLGGATRHVLKEADVPILMAH